MNHEGGPAEGRVSRDRRPEDARPARDSPQAAEGMFAKAFRANPQYATISRLRDGLLVEVTEGFERVTGYRAAEVIGKTVRELDLWAHPEERDEMVRRLRQAGGEVRHFRAHFRTRSGDLRLLEGSIVQTDFGGEPHIIAAGRDITEIERAQDAVRRLNEELERRVRERTAELEEAIRELESFSYSVSHDLRSPLRAIAGYAKLIELDHGAQLDAAGRALLERVVGNAIRMGDIIDDLLDFARIGRAARECTALDMADLVREVLAELPEAEGRRALELRVDPLPAAWGDRSLMRQVWANLIANALKFSRGRAPAVIEIGGAPMADGVRFFVRDNGAGFDMQFAEKLFHVFQRLHRDPSFEGSGVGLAIVARIVQRHGGRVWAEGRPGQGATFHFSLPAPERGA